MDKIKRYIDCLIPVTTCTLRCHYCYITQHRLFGGPLPEFPYSPSYVRKALSKERLGGTCLINFCAGGETTLAPQIVDYAKELLDEGHYVMIVTNGTVTKRLEEFASLPENLKKHLFFKFSYHFLELRSRKLTDRFFSNIKMVYQSGCSFTLEVTPSDELVPYIEELKREAYHYLGAWPHITIARDEKDPNKMPILTKMKDEDYYKTWSVFDSQLFDYKRTIYGHKRKEFCYAGDWSFYLNLQTGIMTQCYRSYYKQNIFIEIDKPIKFLPIGNHCQACHCYNGHSYIALGDIPELEAPSYAEERNRFCTDGTEWLRPEMKEFMESKLFESNAEYSKKQKSDANRTNLLYIATGKLKGGYKRLKKLIL